jgi:hypothetical protein
MLFPHQLTEAPFAYGFAQTQEDPSTAIWFLFFYKNVSFAAVTAPRGSSDTAGESGQV